MLRNLAVLVFSSVLTALSFGQQSYATQSVNVRIGNVILQSAGGVDNSQQFFENLSKDTSVKPPSWNLVNPNPAVNPATGITYPRSAAQYWDVSLGNLSDSQVGNYDILVVAAPPYVTLTAAEAARLRRFMDVGGVLWIDLSSGTQFPDYLNGFPLSFATGSGTSSNFADYLQPVLSYPNAIGYTDLTSMSGTNPLQSGVRPVTSADLALSNLAEDIPPDAARLTAVVGGPTGQIVSVGQEGDGYEVVTSNDITQTIGSATGISDSVESAIKLAVNIMALGTQYGEQGGGAHKTGSNSSDTVGPLLVEWQNTADANNSGFSGSGPFQNNAPVSFKGFVVQSQSSIGKVLIYDGHPSEDLTGQGSSDNGIVDYSLGAPYDLVYSWNVGASPISPPTCIEVSINGVPTDEVWVVDGAGTLHGFYLETGTATPTISPPTNSEVDSGGNDGLGPYAPTFSDGLLFVADNLSGTTPASGRVWIANPVTGTLLENSATSQPWTAGGEANSNLTAVSGPPTVGYVPDADGSGATDRVVYVPSYPNTTATTPVGPMITGLWLGTKGEAVPTSNVTIAGSVVTIVTRASSRGAAIFIPQSAADPAAVMGPKLTILDNNGNPLSQSAMESLFSDQEPQGGTSGLLEYTSSNPGALQTDLQTNGYSVRLDYSLDWGQPNMQALTGTILHSQLSLALCPNGTTRVVDHVVLGPTGMLYAVTSSQTPDSTGDAGGDFYELQDSEGNLNVVVRWSLHDAFTMEVNGATQNVLPAVSNQDPLLQLVGAGGSTSMQDMTFTSAPVVSEGVVYCTAQGASSANVNDTILFAFNANPPLPTITVTSYDATLNPVFTQPDVTSSANRAIPASISAVGIGSYTAEQDPVSGTWKIRFPRLNAIAGTAMSNCLSLSQPVIYSSGAADTFISPDLGNGSNHWSPLEWYTVFSAASQVQGDMAAGAPYVSSGTIYVPIISNLAGGAAMIMGVNAPIAANDPFLVPDLNPWQNQLLLVAAPPGTAISPSNLVLNTDLTWPHIADLNNDTGNRLNLLIQRVTQAQLRASGVGAATSIYGITGGNGRLFAESNQALYGYEPADYVIADSGRAGEFDSVGDPIWATDQSLSSGAADTSQVGNVHTLVSPSRAYPLGNGQIFVVDAGGSRISVVDRTGHEVRSINGFTLDTSFTPSGYTAGETTTFSSPRDLTGFTQYVQAANNPFGNPAPSGQEYWVCYIVADSGNKRLVELVDRYQSQTNANGAISVGAPIAYGELLWHSPASLSGGAYSYSCVTVGTYEPSGYTSGSQPSKYLAAGIGDVAPASDSSSISTSEAPAQGGIVMFPSGPVQPSPTMVQPYIIGTFNLPDNISGLFYTESTNGELSGNFTSTFVPLKNKPIGSLNSLTASYDAVNGSKLMFTDSTGVYELASATLAQGSWVINWMLPRSVATTRGGTSPVYSVMRTGLGNATPTSANPLDFRPTYAQRLASGDVIIVNGYSGRNRKGNASDANVPFQGEIIEIDPTVYNPTEPNLGFVTGENPGLILYQVPPVTGARGIVVPVFATRR